MKNRRNLLTKKCFIGLFLSFTVISLTFSPVLAQSETPVKSETKPLRIEIFSDRKTLKTGEEIKIQVGIDSELITRATVKVFFPESQLELNKDLSCQDGVQKNFPCEVTLPRSNTVNFVFTGKKVGKFNLLVQVSGENTKTKQEITERQQIKDIEIQKQAQWDSKLLSSPFLGVLIGGVLTIITTIFTTVFTNWLQARWKESQRKQWIKKNLPAQLSVTQQAILQKRETGFELWLDKLRTEGYYTELQKFARRNPDHPNLAEDLLRIAFRLRDYERDRKNTLKNVEEEYQDVPDKLTQIINTLQSN